MKKTNKGTKRRVVALAMAFALMFSNTTAFAADTETTEFESLAEEVVRATTEQDEVSEVATATEVSTEAEIAEGGTTEATAEKNASTGPTQVLVGAGDKGLFRSEDEILSEYNGVYLLNYETADQALEAVSYYSEKADFAELNEVVRVAEGEGSGDAVVDALESDEDALSVLNEIVDAGESYSGKCIALIDTGVADGGVSVLGDDGMDDNGHGSLMLKTIKDENPDATVLSIKALVYTFY